MNDEACGLQIKIQGARVRGSALSVQVVMAWAKREVQREGVSSSMFRLSGQLYTFRVMPSWQQGL